MPEWLIVAVIVVWVVFNAGVFIGTVDAMRTLSRRGELTLGWKLAFGFAPWIALRCYHEREDERGC